MDVREKLIDANGLLIAICDDHNINGAHFSRIRRHIEVAPAVDAVEVVRCRDCKRCFKHTTKRNRQKMWICMRNEVDVCVRPDDFCSYGERKEGADNG